MTDEELQGRIENKDHIVDSADARAYQKVFNALSKENYLVPRDFADKVMSHLDQRPDFLREHLWLGIGVFSLIVITVTVSVFLGVRLNFGSFKFISGYGGLIVFSLMLIMIFQIADKTVIRKITSLKH
jgi:hypothetical protein